MLRVSGSTTTEALTGSKARSLASSTGTEYKGRWSPFQALAIVKSERFLVKSSMSDEHGVALEGDEFVIMKDDTCHIVFGSGFQFSLAPSVLYLTNRRIIAKPVFLDSPPSYVYVAKITSFSEKEINDCTVLITASVDAEPLKLFFPDNSKQDAFCDILAKMCAASKLGPAQCDSFALALQRSVLKAKSLAEFFEKYREDPNSALDDPLRSGSTNPAIEILTQINANPKALFETLVATFELSEHLFFGVVVTGVAMLSILFRILPFGVWFFGLVFALVARYGVRVLFSYEEVDAKAREIDSKLRNQFRHLLDAYEECKTTFHNRFLWTCPRQTLEVVMFVLACGLLFSCLDPATILAFSMIGLAVVERWNPFGFGSLTDMVTTLFDLVG